jgi:hypothetical protein
MAEEAVAVKIEDVTNRWNKLRDKDECSLSMDAGNVAKFVQLKESILVQGKIRETLTHLADLRLDKGFFANDKPEAQGDIVTCEGLDAFLVPCVEKSFSISDFLKNYERGTELADELISDINGLVKIWDDKNKGFPGKPYLNSDAIKKEIDPNRDVREKNINTTESAAVACRVIIHLLTLCLVRSEEEYFNELIGERLDVDALGNCLSKAIIFLVDAFQKGEDEKNPIGSATFKGKPGSGWSWTDWKGLRPMLFFTAIAVDAFAELELYLIRISRNDWVNERFKSIYNKNKENLEQYQFCVDMARRWVISTVLTDISTGLGIHIENAPDGSKFEIADNPEGYDAYMPDLKKVEGLHDTDSPLLFYNNLYALLIMLWSFGDWDSSASEVDNKVKSKIERALMQLVNNYTRVDVIREVLNRFPYTFYLPGEGYFKEGQINKEACSYMDSGFLTLLTRQLVLCAVYGVGDPNVLKPLIDQLYIDLLLNRNREDPEYAFLWSAKNKEIFSTQRALQALTFYYAYVKGKEFEKEGEAKTTQPGSGQLGIPSGGRTINLPLQLVLPENIDWSTIFSRGGLSEPLPPDIKEPPIPKPEITAKNFTEYIKKNKVKVAQAMSEEQMAFLTEIDKEGNEVNDNFHDGNISYKDAKVFLNQLAELIKTPWAEDGSPLKKNLGDIKVAHKKLLPKKKK